MTSESDATAPADPWREVVYRAQAISLEPTSRKFRRWRDVVDFVDLVVDDPEWLAISIEAPTDVRVERRSRGAHYSLAQPATATIWIRSGADAAVVLHELAHLARPTAAHGPDFVDAFLRLVRRWSGVEAFGAFRSELIASGMPIH